MMGKGGENRCLVSAPRPDLQNGVTGPGIEKFCHLRNNIRLGDCLAVSYRERIIVVRCRIIGMGNKDMPWDLPHCVEHAGIGDAPRPDLVLHHGRTLTGPRVTLHTRTT